VTAHPEEGWEFVEWTGDVDNNYSDEKYITIEMDQDKEIAAEFAEEEDYMLDIDSTEGGEAVEPGEAEFRYDEEDFPVDLEAEAYEGYEFVEWTGDTDYIEDSEESETTFGLPEDPGSYSITAEFEETTEYELMINIVGEGTVEVDGEEVEDGWTRTFEEVTDVDLEAIPADGLEFIEWEINDEIYEQEIVNLTMDNDKEVTAHFEGEGDPLPPTDPEPEAGAEDVELGEDDEVELSVLVEHEEGHNMDVSFYESGGEKIGTDYDVESGERAEITWYGLEYNTEYEWYVVVSDDGGNNMTISTIDVWSFITEEYVHPAYFEVEITDYEEEVDEGDTVTVEYDVENTGDVEGTQEIVFFVDGDEEDSMDVTIAPNEELRDEFTWEADEAGEHELEVASDDDSDSVTIIVEELDPAYFEVEITDYDGEVYEGETVTIEYMVTNTGDVEGTQEVVFFVDGDKEDSMEVTIYAYDIFTGELTWEAEEEGEYELEVASDDDFASVIVTVEEEPDPAYFEIEIIDYDGEVDMGETVTVNYIVQNTGDVKETQDIVISIDGDEIDTYGIQLDADETLSEDFTWETDAAGDYELEVASEDTSDSVTITVEETEYDLTINLEGEGAAEVDGEEVEDGWIGTYDRDTEVELEALPDEDWYFVKWAGDHVGTSEEITIIMDSDKSITAEFDEEDPVEEYDLTVGSTGGGEVVQPGEGTFEYEHGEVLLIEAVPADDYEFVEWSGDTETIGNPNAWLTTIEMVDDHEITANFAEETYELDISSLEGGQITSPGEGTFDYTYGTDVEIEAEVEEHYNFVEWIGDTETISNTEARETTITIEDDHQIMALFEKDTHQLTIEAGEGGKVTLTGEGTFEHGIFEYEHGEEEIIVAVAEGDQRFKEWTGDTEEIENVDWKVTRINMTEDFNIKAEFEDKTPEPHSNTYGSEIYELKIDSTRGGYLYLDDERKEGEFEREEDDEVELRAVADDDHHFVEWIGDNETLEDPTSSEVTIEMNSETVLVARFARDTHDIDISTTEGGEVEVYGGDEFGYEVGETIVIEASVEEHHHFVEWAGEIGDIEDPNSRLTTMEMTGEQEITANFAPNVYELTIQSTVGGEVIAPGEDTFTYEHGEIDLEAIEVEGYHFVEWIGDNGTIEDLTADETTIEITDDTVIIAEFAPEIQEEEEDDIAMMTVVGIVVIIAIILAIVGYMMKKGGERSGTSMEQEISLEEDEIIEEEDKEEELFEEEL